MALTQAISVAFLKQVSAASEGLAFILGKLLMEETHAESGVFERLARSTDDESLLRRIKKHHADELKHIGLLRACLAEVKPDALPVPEHLSAASALDRALGFPSGRVPRSDRDVMELFVALQVVEERAATEFPQLVSGLRATPAGEILAAIGRDECLHVHYSRAGARRYAPSPAAYDAALRELRSLEERIFRENSRDCMTYLLDRGWLRSGRIARGAWQAVASALRAVPIPMPTLAAAPAGGAGLI